MAAVSGCHTGLSSVFMRSERQRNSVLGGVCEQRGASKDAPRSFLLGRLCHGVPKTQFVL